MHPLLDRLLAEQDGVVSRSQALTAGVSEAELRRLRSRRELVPIHRGIYVDHTGEPTWSQRAWAAVLATWPAALSHSSALRRGRRSRQHGSQDLIEVAVDRDRHLARLRRADPPSFGPPRGACPVAPRPTPRALPRGDPRRRRLRSHRTGCAGRAGARCSVASHDRRPGWRTPWTSASARPRGRWMAEVLHDVAAGNVLGPRARLPPRRRASARTDARPPAGAGPHRIPRHLPRRGVRRRPRRRARRPPPPLLAPGT